MVEVLLLMVLSEIDSDEVAPLSTIYTAEPRCPPVLLLILVSSIATATVPPEALT